MDTKSGKVGGATNPPVRLRIKLLHPAPVPPSSPPCACNQEGSQQGGQPATIARGKCGGKHAVPHRLSSADQDWLNNRLARKNAQAFHAPPASQSAEDVAIVGKADMELDSQAKSDNGAFKRQRSARKHGGSKTWMSAAGALQRLPCHGTKKRPFTTQMLVWAKLQTRPWWPARVATSSEIPEDVVKAKKEDHICVKFYGLPAISYVWMKAQNLAHYEDNFDQFFKQNITPDERSELEAALGEVRKVCARRAARCVDALRSRGLYNTVAKHPIRPDRRRLKVHRTVKETDKDTASKEKDGVLAARHWKRKLEKRQGGDVNGESDSEHSDDEDDGEEDDEEGEEEEEEEDDDATSLESIPKKKVKVVGGSMSAEENDKPPNDVPGSPATKVSGVQSLKKTGDGRYRECAACNVGGKLTGCDFCPRAYHLECLTPQLKELPPGNWKCPGCLEDREAVQGTNVPHGPKGKKEDVVQSGPSTCKPKGSDNTSFVKRKRKDVGHESAEAKGVKNDTEGANGQQLDKPRKKRKDGDFGNLRKKKQEELAFANCEGCGAEVSSSELGSGRGFCKSCGLESGMKAGNKSGKKAMEDLFPLFPLDDQVDRILGCRKCLVADPSSSITFNSSNTAVRTGSGLDASLAPPSKVDSDSAGLDTNQDASLQGNKAGASAEQGQIQTGSASKACFGSCHGIVLENSSSVKASNATSAACMETRNSLPEEEQTAVPMEVDSSAEQIDASISRNVPDTDSATLKAKEISPGPSSAPEGWVEKSAAIIEQPTVELSRRYEGESGISPETCAGPSKSLSPLRKAAGNVSTTDGDDRVPDRSVQDEKVSNLEFLVKWVGKAHIHNQWISENRLVVLAKRKLDNYRLKFGTASIVVVDEQWFRPQRVIARRKVKGKADRVLVKWTGLSYEDCTWEQVDEPVIAQHVELIYKFEKFEAQALASSNSGNPGKSLSRPEVEPLTEQPKELKGGTLFPHQMEALNWLRKCWLRRKNVILADEMGLGKTISACAFLSTLYHEFGTTSPCLVLVPLSTMPNWMAEFALWAPSLNVIEYHGTAKARAAIRQFEWYAGENDGKKQRPFKFNVMLTTYEMVINDSNQLRAVPWESLIVDEGHRLKNSESKLSTLLNTYTFAHRVLLTGTPLQNNLGEMYNLLDFLKPDRCPASIAAIQEQFNSMSTTEQVDELKKLVAPHMLRRLKKDTMQNIPPKQERIVPVELASVQAEYYRALLTRNYQVLRHGLKAGQQKSMLNIVMQLRKVCNHPYLISGTEPEKGTPEFLQEMRINASGKLKLLHLLLAKLKEQGHRVLIFSQMAKLLDILEDYLTYQFGSESYERVSGNVPLADRQAAISRFNQDTSRFVFLLSTRSCGLGINLATADTVIIYDSDFNPHADIQAMNRAHRIGQSKTLLVYRLVVRASVEERILQLAKKKLMLDHLFANKSGSQKEVEDILRWGTEELFHEDTPQPDGSKDAPIPLDASDGDGTDETDGKQKKKASGLGDVYGDKCLKSGRSKIVWDDAALAGLLDRSEQSSSHNYVAEGEQEGDILGSMKNWESNEQDAADELDTEDLPCKENEVVEQGGKAEEDDDWEKLLRERWEKLQMEKEAVLGRGKRQRKIISYSEAVAVKSPVPSSSDSDAREEEDEPGYTAAGRALKQKLAKLRDRQKERIALRGKEITEDFKGAGKTDGEFQPVGGLSLFQASSRGQNPAAPRTERAHATGGPMVPCLANDSRVSCDQQMVVPPINVETHTQGNASFPHRYYTVMGMPVEPLWNARSETDLQGRMHVGRLQLAGYTSASALPEMQRGQSGSSLSDRKVASADVHNTAPVFSSGLLAVSGPGHNSRHESKDMHMKSSTEGPGKLFMLASNGLDINVPSSQRPVHHDFGLGSAFVQPNQGWETPNGGESCHVRSELESQENALRPSSVESRKLKNRLALSGQSGAEPQAVNVDDLAAHATRHDTRQISKGWLPGDESSGILRDPGQRILGQPRALPNLGMSVGSSSQDPLTNPFFKGPLQTVQGVDMWKNPVKSSSFSLGAVQLKDVPGTVGCDLSSAEYAKLHMGQARQILDSQTRDASALAFLDTLAVGKARAFEEDRRREQSQEPWTEEELDGLWKGMRRYGQDWVTMVKDWRLGFHSSRTASDVERRWRQNEQVKVFGEALAPVNMKNTVLSNGGGGLETLKRLPDQLCQRIGDNSSTAQLLSEVLKSSNVLGLSKSKSEVAVEKFLQEKNMLDRRESGRWTGQSASDKSPSFSSMKYNTTLGLGMPEDEKLRLPEVSSSNEMKVDFQKLPDLSQLRAGSAGSMPASLPGMSSPDALVRGEPSSNTSLIFPLGSPLDGFKPESRAGDPNKYWGDWTKYGVKSLPDMTSSMLDHSQRMAAQQRQDLCQETLSLQCAPSSLLGLGSSRTSDSRSTVPVALPYFVSAGGEHRKYPGSGMDKKRLSRHLSAGKGLSLSHSKESCSRSTSSLPHWMKDAIKSSEPAAPAPSLAPTIAAVVQAVAFLHGDTKTLLPPPALPLPPLKEPRPPGRKKKRRFRQRKHTNTKSQQGTASLLEGPYQPVGLKPRVGDHPGRNFAVDLPFSASCAGSTKASLPLLPFAADVPIAQLSLSSDLSLTPPFVPPPSDLSLCTSGIAGCASAASISDFLKRGSQLDINPASILGGLKLEPGLLDLHHHRSPLQLSSQLSLALQKGREAFTSRQGGISEQQAQDPSMCVSSESGAGGRGEEMKQAEILPPWLRSAASLPTQAAAVSTSRDSAPATATPLKVRQTTTNIQQKPLIASAQSDDSSSQTQTDPGFQGKQQQLNSEAYNDVSSDETISDS